MRISIRAVFACLSLFAATATALADGNQFKDYPSGISGDFVVYRDFTWKTPTWVGFLEYSDSTWGAFALTPSTGSRVAVLFSSELDGDNLVLTGQKIISDIKPEDSLAVNYLMRLLPDLWSWRHAGTGSTLSASEATAVSGKPRSGLIPPLVRAGVSSDAFGGAINLIFAPEVPVFNLRGIAGADGSAALSLVRVGRIRSGGDSVFFNFAPQGEAKSSAPFAPAVGRKASPKTVNGITLKLDDQWAPAGENVFFLGSEAAIIVDSLDLSLMQMPEGDLPLSLLRLFSVSGPDSWADPSESAVSGTAKRIVVTNLFFDGAQNVLNRDVKVCFPSADGKSCVIVSLSVRESAWKANRAYFDALIP